MSDDPTPEQRCYRTALRLLGYRFRGSEELRRKLAERGFEREIVAGVLGRLAEEGWIDDARFARSLAEAKGRKGIGPKRIALELRGLGVDGAVAREALRDAEEEGGGPPLAEIVAKRIRILGRRNGPGWVRTPEGRKKLLAYLLQQGYEYASAAEAVDAALEKDHGEA
ncbi:MAG TPA: RecX family transcriptional regulator [Thermoanaerobaculia bacterium]|nr:RecX family transcriptional regulator [Thermoanaerobaculia bacterium]